MYLKHITGIATYYRLQQLIYFTIAHLLFIIYLIHFDPDIFLNERAKPSQNRPLTVAPRSRLINDVFYVVCCLFDEHPIPSRSLFDGSISSDNSEAVAMVTARQYKVSIATRTTFIERQ